MTDLNEALLDIAGGALELETPALVLDLDRFEANLETMRRYLRHQALALRPHTKTHKCLEIGRRQMAAGAVGLCCARIGEAEVFAGGGLPRLLLTAPVVGDRSRERLLALNETLEELLVVVDHADAVAALTHLTAARPRSRQPVKPLRVLLDLDPGLHRTGMPLTEEALTLAQQIDAAPSLELAGVQFYAGHLMHVSDFAERQQRSLEALETLAAFLETLERVGLAAPIRSGGGTGTYDIDPAAGVLTDLQAGSYIFMDSQYNRIEAATGSHRFLTSLYVQTRVISCNHPGLATTDAGLKAFATDDRAPEIASGGPQGASAFFFGDEQGGLRWDSGETVRPGAVLRAVTPHCDPTINLYDVLHVVRGDTLVDLWPIEARGRSA